MKFCKDSVESFYKILGNDAKFSVNAFIGMCNKKKDKYGKLEIHTNPSICFSKLTKWDSYGSFTMCSQPNDKFSMYKITSEKEDEMITNSAPIYQHVLNMSWLKLWRLRREMGGEIIQIKTDSITVLIR